MEREPGRECTTLGPQGPLDSCGGPPGTLSIGDRVAPVGLHGPTNRERVPGEDPKVVWATAENTFIHYSAVDPPGGHMIHSSHSMPGVSMALKATPGMLRRVERPPGTRPLGPPTRPS